VATAKALAEAVSNVAAVPGINDSTANYIAMRAFSEPDAFPAKNLGLRSTLSAAESHVSESQVIARAEAWRPWRAYAAMHLLRDQP
jgi:AraC family transcriptional regulator of adaptative response / DNA-3-methyladenine glycosylase II